MRGLEGQKLRGFSTGETVYGYYTKPVGELKLAAGKARLLRLRSQWQKLRFDRLMREHLAKYTLL